MSRIWKTTPLCQNDNWFNWVPIPPPNKNKRITDKRPHTFLLRRDVVQSTISWGNSCWRTISLTRTAMCETPPVSRKYDWFEMFRRKRFARRERQSWTTTPPWVKEPSSLMMENTRSKAFSKATSFWRSGDVAVRAVKRRRASAERGY